MGEGQSDGMDRVIIPSSFRARAASGFGLLFALPVMATLMWLLLRIGLLHHVNVFYLAMFGIVGVVLVVRGWRLRHEPALVFDAEGARDRKGDLLFTWAQVGLIWVGQAKLRGWQLSGPHIVVWTASALDYAKRTGFAPEPHVGRGIESTASARQVAEQIQRFATCPIRLGRAADYKQLVRQLRGQG